ncbi:MAG: Na+/H+ antiporter subunit C [Planctomycetota bacterium]
MSVILAVVIGALTTCSVFLLLQRSIIEILMGLSLLSHTANLVIFTSAGLVLKQPPIIAAGETLPVTPHADPLPQALILTAIVISFGVTAFTLAVAWRANFMTGSINVDETDEDAS